MVSLSFLHSSTLQVNFPQAQMKAFVDSLHASGQKYVVIIDPGIQINSSYAPYKQGIASNVFVKDKYGSNFIGDVWPGKVHYPDFLNPNTR